MSLDVWLTLPKNHPQAPKNLPRSSKVFVRENGQTKEITREEYIERYGSEPTVLLLPKQDDDNNEYTEVWSSNITGNLRLMAEKAKLERVLWHPYDVVENSDFKAKDIVVPLGEGLLYLLKNEQSLQKLNPENGWGSYSVLTQFVISYLEACLTFPDASVHTWM